MKHKFQINDQVVIRQETYYDGRVGIIRQIDNTAVPYQIKFSYGVLTSWFREQDLELYCPLRHRITQRGVSVPCETCLQQLSCLSDYS